jgi:serine O-acetyltransferase
MRFSYFLAIVKSDLHRLTDVCLSSFFKTLFFSPTFRIVFYFRLCKYLKVGGGFTRYFLYLPVKLLFKLSQVRFGISLPDETDIGPGFYIGHCGGIVINPRAIIGKNFNLSQGVTIGQTNRGERKGTPVIGDNVYVGPGAKIIGRIAIGDGAAIGANAVVTKDIPPNGVAIGIPAKVISTSGSVGYIERTNYPYFQDKSSRRS